jgi:hypothetical protein
VIGAFEVTLANENGVLEVNTAPLNLPGLADTVRPTAFGGADRSFREAQAAAGRLVDSFTMTGAGARYRADIAVKKTPEITNPLRYLGKTHDKCGETNLRVKGINGMKLVRKGESADVRLASNRITWYCRGSDEATTCDATTDYVRVWRESSGRDFHWACFKEEPKFTNNLPEGFVREFGNWVVWRNHGLSHCYVVPGAHLDAFNTDVRNVPAFVSDRTTYVGQCPWP